jgi:poly-gamma-glutamate capsule biosynthesis protein CapA/YwtB (metallophosphatase superfamily)
MRGKHRRPTRLPRAAALGVAAAILVASVSAWAVIRSSGDQTQSDRVAPPPSTPPATAASSPSTSPTPSPSAEPRRGRLVIRATGDVNLDPNYIPNLRTNGYEYAWSGLGGLFRRDDLTIVNLECAVSELGSPLPKDFTFRGDPAALPAMRKAGVDVANLGNNHAGDFGPEALLDSRRNLLENRIRPVGVGRNEAQAHEPAVFDMKGWSVAVLGFGGVVPTEDWIAGSDHPGMADGDDVASMVAAVEAADATADIVIVTIHWGVELDTKPRPEDVERAFALIDAGADAIFGHHAHRLQPMSRYKGRPIFWSLGNFVWPNFSVAGSTTGVAEVTVTRSGKVMGRLIPAFIESSGHPVLQGS